MNAWSVLDLGFGDAGKGLLVDAIVRRTGARTVLRFNGGAQAGHNVVCADGRHHTFAQVGAGSFVPGVRTLLGPEVVVHPTALLVERAMLARKGVDAAVEIHRDCRINTPWHQALNRLRELSRAQRHGSVGVGVGETMRDATVVPPIRAADLRDPARLHDLAEATRRRLASIADSLSADGPVAERERTLFEPAMVAGWIRQLAAFDVPVVDGFALRGDVVCEGAQGLLLDAHFGFHPHTTWTDTTDAPARALGLSPIRIGVIRVWMTRHGAGPFPSEDPTLSGVMDDHNQTHAWQGHVRVGHFDPNLVRYALDALGGVDHLCVTHVDALPRRPWRVVAPYPMPHPGHIAAQAALAARLAQLDPLLEAPSEALPTIAERLGRRVDIIARGNQSKDVDFRFTI